MYYVIFYALCFEWNQFRRKSRAACINLRFINKIVNHFQLEKSVSEKERSALELEQKLESEKQAAQSAKAMLEDKISEAQTSK